MDTIFEETPATPNAESGDLQDAALGGSELNRQLVRLLLTGHPSGEGPGANFDTGDAPADAVVGSDAAAQEPSGAANCAYCALAFEKGEQRLMINGSFYHSDFCAHYAKQMAGAAE